MKSFYRLVFLIDVDLIDSVEYPFVVPQPAENVRSSSPKPVETMTTLTKAMKLNVNKPSESQGSSLFCRSIVLHASFLLEPSTMTNNEKGFDTNTFVLKKKERRKMPTAAAATDNSFNMVKLQITSGSIDRLKSILGE